MFQLNFCQQISTRRDLRPTFDVRENSNSNINVQY